MSNGKDGSIAMNGKSDGHPLPAGWSWTTLKEIADLKGGVAKGQRRNNATDLRRVAYLRVANVQRGYFDLTEVKEIDATEEEIAELRLQPRDVLFNEGGDRDKLGRGWVWRGELETCIHQNHVFRARLRSSEIDPKFLSWYGNSEAQRYFWNEGKHTTNLASINLSKLGALPVPFPPVEEQAKIVAEVERLFSLIDAGVAALKRVQANLKRYRASVLQAACEGRLVPTEEDLARVESRNFEPASVMIAGILARRRTLWEAEQIRKMREKGQFPTDDKWKSRYKVPVFPVVTPSSALPGGWTWASVEQLTTRVVDGVHKKPNYTSVGVPFVTVRNLTAGSGIDFTRLNYVSEEDHTEFIKRTHPERDDILVTKDGTLGVIRRVNTDRTFSIFVSVALVKPVDRRMSSYLSIALSSPQVQAQMVPKGSGLQHIHLEDLREDCIPVPPMAEQERITLEVERRLSGIEASEAAIQVNLLRATRLRQAILKRAFEGKLVPQDLNDEPASVLLERIRQQQADAPATTRSNGRKRAAQPALPLAGGE